MLVGQRGSSGVIFLSRQQGREDGHGAGLIIFIHNGANNHPGSMRQVIDR